jgi:flagellar hook-associated protein 3 FlgL
MRISTNTIFEMGGSSISNLQVGLAKTQQQISSGRKILTPADDPVASARALEVSQSDAMNDQFTTNRQNAKSSLSSAENTLAGVTSLLQDAKTLTVSAGNGALTDTERGFMATELRGRYEQLLGLANTTDGTGNYIFSGYQTSTPPFVATASGVQYQGDQGQQMLQVDISRQMAMSAPGSDVFGNVRTGNGTFVAAAAATNTGSGIVSPGSVVNAAALTGHNYSLNFTVAAGVTTYDVVDLTGTLPASPPPVTLSAGNSYVSGQAISFDGMQFDISGSPANGDKFTVQPSTSQSVFKTLDDLITTLGKPVNSASSSATLAAGLSTANLGIDKALDNVLTTRASVGSRLKEIDALDSVGEDRGLQYKQTLSTLQDLDYAKAITELTQQQTTLDAAQKSFVKTSGLSLFNFL